MSCFVALKNRQHDVVVTPLGVTLFQILGLQLQCNIALIILTLSRNSVERVSQTKEIVGSIALCELFHRVFVGYLSFLVAPCKLVVPDIVGPDVHMTGLHNECQPFVASQVAASQSSGLDAISNTVDTHQQ